MSNKEPKKPLTDEEISKDILSGEGKAGRIEHDGSFVSVSEVRRLLNIAESEARASERERIRETLLGKAFTEKLADLEHDRWSRWEKYRASITNSIEEHKKRVGYNLKEDIERVDNWKRKSELLYLQLTEQEKESDRVEAHKTQKAIHEAIGRIRAKRRLRSDGVFGAICRKAWQAWKEEAIRKLSAQPAER